MYPRLQLAGDKYEWICVVARELISPETGLEFLRRLCDPAQRHTKFLNVESSIADILSSTEFLIYPNANPSGRRITERGHYCNRVNDRGVDLNRNWGEHWSSASQHADTYPGTKAWSEAEVLILARASTKFKPTIFISIHSGSLHMLSPFAFKASTAGEPASSRSAINPPGLAGMPLRQSHPSLVARYAKTKTRKSEARLRVDLKRLPKLR